MAHRLEKYKATILRKKGYSYSQIKTELGISKSTLSGWLSNMPLSKKRIVELRDKNPQRIERYRNTMRLKKQCRLDAIYEKVAEDIGALNKRDLFIAGVFLYWGEGYKRADYTTGFANSDPMACKFMINWLHLLGVSKDKILLNLQLYSDMSVKDEIKYWSRKLNVNTKNIKTRIKESKLSSITYKGRFGHGTCNIKVYNRDLSEYILTGLKYVGKYVEKNMRA